MSSERRLLLEQGRRGCARHSARSLDGEGLGALLPGMSREVGGPDGQCWGGKIWATHGCNRVGPGAGRALVLLCSCPAHSNFSKSWVFCLFAGGHGRVGRAQLRCQPLQEVGLAGLWGDPQPHCGRAGVRCFIYNNLLERMARVGCRASTGLGSPSTATRDTP